MKQTIARFVLEDGELFVNMRGLISLCLLRPVDLLGWIKAGDPVGGLAREDDVSSWIVHALTSPRWNGTP